MIDWFRRNAPVLVAGAFVTALLGGCTAEAPAGESVPGVRAGVTLPAPEDRTPAPVDAALFSDAAGLSRG